MEIELGNGDIEITMVYRGEQIGVALLKQSEPHPIGEFCNDEGREFYPEDQPDDCVIWLNKLESARILQDAIAQAVLKMQGIPREVK